MNLRNKPGIPHKGWECVKITDVKEAFDSYQICEMCGKEKIRFVYSMKNIEYPKILEVGYVCAGDMTEDYEGTKKREKILKSRLSKKSRWVNRKWKISERGNSYLIINDNLIVVFYYRDIWKFSINSIIYEKSFYTEDEAKLKAFDFLFPPHITV